MATEHRLIPDAQRHEPKGISTATEGQIYRSNGAASGAWKDDLIILQGTLEDVSEASFVLIPIPVNCTVVSIKTTLANAITVADSTLTVTRGGDSGVLATIIISYASSAEGSSTNSTPSANANLIANTHNYLKIASDGGSTTASELFVSVKVKVTE